MVRDPSQLTPSERMRLGLVGARLVLDDEFDPAEAVTIASELVAQGIDSESVVELACQPAERSHLDGHKVEGLVRAALAELGVELPSRQSAGWTMARWIGAAILDGTVPPSRGALRLWGLWGDCAQAPELAEMLQLHDAWEEAVGPARLSVEAEILEYAPKVIAAADRHLS